MKTHDFLIMISKNKGIFNWDFVRFLKNHSLSQDAWYHISCSGNLPENFIRQYHDKLDWFWLSRYQSRLNQTLLTDFIEKFDWKYIFQHRKYLIGDNQDIEMLIQMKGLI